MTQQLSQKVLDKIKDEKIQPKAKWVFLFKDCAIWFVFALALVVGSLSVSVIIFLLLHDNLNIPDTQNGLKILFLSLPYFWLVILAVFLVIAYYNFQYTKHGYRYNPYLIIIISILLSLIIGSFVYALGGGQKIEEVSYQRMSFYQVMSEGKRKMLLENQDKVLIGMVVNIEPQGLIHLHCCGRQQWQVVYDPIQLELPIITPGERIIIMGHKQTEGVFEAEQVRFLFTNHIFNLQKPLAPAPSLKLERKF